MATLEQVRVDELPSLDEEVACCMHEFIAGAPPPCDRPATVVAVYHGCMSHPACMPCYRKIVALAKTRIAQSSNSAMFHCIICNLKSRNLKELLWFRPL